MTGTLIVAIVAVSFSLFSSIIIGAMAYARSNQRMLSHEDICRERHELIQAMFKEIRDFMYGVSKEKAR